MVCSVMLATMDFSVGTGLLSLGIADPSKAADPLFRIRLGVGMAGGWVEREMPASPSSAPGQPTGGLRTASPSLNPSSGFGSIHAATWSPPGRVFLGPPCSHSTEGTPAAKSTGKKMGLKPPDAPPGHSHWLRPPRGRRWLPRGRR